MIFVEMYGRLGNQFFRYAVARAYQLRYFPNDDLVLNFSQINKLSTEDPSFYDVLDDYNVANYKTYNKKGSVILHESNLLQKAIASVYYLGLRNIPIEDMNRHLNYQKRWSPILNSLGLFWYRYGYYDLGEVSQKKKFFSGSFEDSKYFEDFREILLTELSPKHPPMEKNLHLYDAIESTNSICITIRRGDYESNEEVRKLHSVCNQNYFEQAIAIMKEKVENPVFFLFSDDIEWVKENIQIDAESYYEDGDDPVWEKLRMMSRCKHFIISNSSFSWWSQWLSTNPAKVVVSPNRWYNNDYESPLIDENWILIDPNQEEYIRK